MSDRTLSSISTANSGSSSARSHPSTASQDPSLSEQPRRRKIGRWFLGETLGKGGYSWVKKGYDRKTGQAVALKFMDKKDSSESWQETQTRQVRTEIEALKQIQHPNILRLLAYNLNARYPDKTGVQRNVILLVLEYMPGGELFDILYYSAQLEENVARTYFRQLIDGIEACHRTGICHRDIKPQNLLLNEYYQLKITDFGLAKIFEEKEEEMHSHHVGTRGYQAPEILDRQPYTTSCDIFSAGVVLFILLTGYPPFEHARSNDKWYRPLTKGVPKKFWKNHHGCGVSGLAKDLITRMFSADPSARITIDDIRGHPWYNQAVLPMEKLAEALRLRHRMMEVQRRNDPRKQMVLDGSNDIRNVVKTRAGIEAAHIYMPPMMSIKGGSQLQTYFSTSLAREILASFKIIVEEIMGGTTEVDYEESRMKARVQTVENADADTQIAATKISTISVQVFHSEERSCNCFVFKRLEGDYFSYRNVVRTMIQKGGFLLDVPIEDVPTKALSLLDDILPNWRDEYNAERAATEAVVAESAF